MLTLEQSDYLIGLPKKLIVNDNSLDKHKLFFKFPWQEKFLLLSDEDKDFSFLLEVNQSKRNSLKISLHHQEDEAKIGLLRIDYNGTHKNPETIIDSLPEKFHRYAGKWFEYNEHHIHFYVEGYRPLDWAIPISDYDFKVKEIKNSESIVEAFQLFCKKINLITEIEISVQEDIWNG